MKRKFTLMLVACLAVVALLSGCNNTVNRPSPSPSVSPDLSLTPGMSASPGMTSPSPAASPDTAQPTTNTNNDTSASAIKAEVDKLSEVEESKVVVVGNVALIGLTFTSQYQGGITERITEMVQEKVKGADENVLDVVLTDNKEQITKIDELLKRGGQDISKDFADILSAIDMGKNKQS